MNRIAVIFAVGMCSIVVAAEAPRTGSRTWTYRDGKKVKGEIARVAVTVKDGRRLGSLDIRKLSDADLEHLAAWILSHRRMPPKAKAKKKPLVLARMTPEQASVGIRRAGGSVDEKGGTVYLAQRCGPREAAMVRWLPNARAVYATDVLDEEIAALSTATQITSLFITDSSETLITNASLVHIGKMKGLKYLSLVGSRITDKGLMHLRTLKQLEFLNVQRTRVTKEGIETLYEHLPKCVAKFDERR